jgi:hypothetical protein
MPKKPNHRLKADDKEQSRAFIEKAHGIEADKERSAAGIAWAARKDAQAAVKVSEGWREF